MTARATMTRDYADMPAAQIAYGYDQWDAHVEVDADEIARIRSEKVVTDDRI